MSILQKKCDIFFIREMVCQPGHYKSAFTLCKLCSNLFGFVESCDYACDRYKSDAKCIVVVVVKAPQKDTSNLKYVERMNNL